MVAPHLFAPLQLRGVHFRNRIGVSPMCQYSSADGFATDWHLAHLGARAVGGAALVFTEATAVSPEGRISPDDLGLWKDEQIEMLARIFRFIMEQGAIPGVQLAHAGRKASTSAPWKGGGTVPEAAGGWNPIYAASAIPFQDGYLAPKALERAGIDKVLRDFAAAAKRCLAAGSSGGAVPHAGIPVAPGYQTSCATKTRAEAGIATGAVGMITAPEQADQIIRNAQADIVFLARELLRDPYWPLHAARRLKQDFTVPVQYRRAF
ncbi:MAG TPA: hypothetical protein VGQ82_02090 [Chthoniobacterales bacterium]|nr:hypothetical protein [Chthoniobacterales bacterium]